MLLKNKLTGLSQYTLGLAGFAAIILVSVALFLGFAAVVKFLYPLFYALAVISICVFIIVILPLSLFNRFRADLAAVSVALSMICAAAIWAYSFLVIVGYLGWAALFLFLFFKAVAPVAVIGLFFKGRWVPGICIIAGLLITYAMRFYSRWLEKLYYASKEKDAGIIDVEAKNISE